MCKVDERGAVKRDPPLQVSMNAYFDQSFIGVQKDRSVCFVHLDSTSRSL